MSKVGTPIWIGRVQAQHIEALYNDAPLSLEQVDGNWQIDSGTDLGLNTLSAGDIVQVNVPSKEITLLARRATCAERIYGILARHNIDPLHSAETLAEARQFLKLDLDPENRLTDLSELPFVTIDNADSRDLDQAVYVELGSAGTFDVYYALADASWFVKPGTSLFSAALERSVTYYTPLFNAPMLPRELSEDLVSLNEEVVRRALTFKITLDEHGHSIDHTVYQAKIRSRAKLTYDGVQAYYNALADADEHSFSNADYGDSLRALKTVGSLLLQNSRDRDVVELDRREPTITVADAESNAFSISIRDRLDSERYNEQISLLCNTQGAEYLNELGLQEPDIQSIFRVHLPPRDQRMNRLSEQINALVDVHSLDDRWRWSPAESIAGYIQALPKDANQVRIRQAIERLVMMTNRASNYKDKSDQHHALKVGAYARFSSPMREMVGIFTHKELCEALNYSEQTNTAKDEQLQQAIIQGANRAKSIQRSLEKAFELEAIRDYLDRDLSVEAEDRPWRKATVIGITKSKIFINIDGFALDLKLYRSDLEKLHDCKYLVDEVSAVSINESAPALKLGNGIKVRTREWSTQVHRYQFDVAPLQTG